MRSPEASDLRGSSEEALVALARERSEAAVRELVRRLNPRLFRVARGILDSDAEAEEVVQESYLSAFAHLSEFRGEAQFSTWITRIVLNGARMRRRRARPQVEYDTVARTVPRPDDLLSFPNGGIEGPESALGRSQLRGLLEAAIGGLPPELRLVFLLRESEGMNVASIAREIGLNPITVRTRLFRARRKLRVELSARLRGGFEAAFPFDGARCAGMADRIAADLKGQGHLS